MDRQDSEGATGLGLGGALRYAVVASAATLAVSAAVFGAGAASTPLFAALPRITASVAAVFGA